MAGSNIKRAVEKATAFEHTERDDDLKIWTVDLPGLNRSVDVEATTEDEARAKVLEHLQSEG